MKWPKKLNWLLAFVMWFFRFLGSEKIPLWVTLALALGGGYVIAPFINEQVQKESLRREFLVSSLQALSTDTIALIGDVNAILTETSPSASDLKKIDGEIVSIQFKMVQLNIAVPLKRGKGIAVQESLAELQTSLQGYAPAKRPEVQVSLNDFSTKSFALYEDLISSAGLL